MPSSRSPVLALLVVLLAAGCAPAEPPPVDTRPSWPGTVWPVSTPEAEGVDGAAIDALVADIEAGQYGLVDALLVIRHGRVVADHRFAHDYEAISAPYEPVDHIYNYDHPSWHPYYRGTDLHSLQSVTKSVTSAAVGIAIDGA